MIPELKVTAVSDEGLEGINIDVDNCDATVLLADSWMHVKAGDLEITFKYRDPVNTLQIRNWDERPHSSFIRRFHDLVLEYRKKNPEEGERIYDWFIEVLDRCSDASGEESLETILYDMENYYAKMLR